MRFSEHLNSELTELGCSNTRLMTYPRSVKNFILCFYLLNCMIVPLTIQFNQILCTKLAIRFNVCIVEGIDLKIFNFL